MSACFSSSMAHGPPMSTSGCPPPTAIGPIWTSRVAIIGAGSACPAQTVGGLPEMVLGSVRSSPCPVLQARFHEAGEQRMRLPRPRPELGVELAGHEVGMILDLDDLDELFLRPQTRHAQAVLLEGLEVVVVDLVPLAVTLTDHRLGPVEARSHRALGHQDGIEAQPHGAALVGERPLLGQEIDHEVRRAGGELGRVGALQAAHGPCELDHGTLHAEADAEVRHALLARVAYRLDLALDAAVAEAPRHQNTVDVGEVGGGAVALDVLGVHPDDVDLRLVRDAPVHQRLDEALVGIPQVDVFAHHGQARGRARRLHAAHDVLPARKVDGPVLEAETLDDDRVQALPVEHERNLVDRIDVFGRDDRLFLVVAAERDLRLDARRQVAVGAAEQDVGLDTDRAQFLHRVLRRLRLQLRGRLDERHEREVDVEYVLLADVLLQLADRLEKRQPLDVADGPADLDDDDVLAGADLADHGLDLVGDVRDHLHRPPEIIAAPLLRDDRVVDLARGDVVVAGDAGRGEPLVVAEVEVGLAAVVGHEDLAVLVGTHRP